MPYKKGQSGNPKGKPKGTRNKISSDVRDYILKADSACRKKGKGLQACALRDPQWFYEKIYAKIIPKPVEIKTDIEGEITIRWQR